MASNASNGGQPHRSAPSQNGKAYEFVDHEFDVVVVGAGPGGLEAARVSAERGHDVVLFEREDSPGGQINIAAKAP